ncbi:DUF3810 domain-containing protein [Natranaerobius trueperi]|nr:DUF3810 domain-containing protein [Natranaerobius trueperi]
MKRFIKPSLYRLLILGLIISLLQDRFPSIIESFYSTTVYYWVIRPYSLLTGVVPFSIAELLIIFITCFIIYQLINKVTIMIITPRQFLNELPKKLTRLGTIIAVIFVVFNFMWGFNYNRYTFEEISDIHVEDTTVVELKNLALSLTNRANELRKQVEEDENGVMKISDGFWDMFNRADKGFLIASETYPELSGNYGRPKGVILSPLLSYAGIGGFYFPFTAEANVNINMPHHMIPFTINHEMAHQAGFAREDEANYIAYLTSTKHPDPDFQYSGVMMALTYTMNVLHRYDVNTWLEIRSEYSDGLRRDIKAAREYQKHYDGTTREVSTRLNNTYLVANRQDEGVQSYGKMVDLLIAKHRLDILE